MTFFDSIGADWNPLYCLQNPEWIDGHLVGWLSSERLIYCLEQDSKASKMMTEAAQRISPNDGDAWERFFNKQTPIQQSGIKSAIHNWWLKHGHIT